MTIPRQLGRVSGENFLPLTYNINILIRNNTEMKFLGSQTFIFKHRYILPNDIHAYKYV